RTRRLLPLVVLVALALPAQARPPHKKALAEYFGPYLAPKLNDCRTCHLPEKDRQAEEEYAGKPHNAFGARLAKVRAELRKADKPYNLPARLEAIANEDSDGDGISNLLELLSGHFPGDAEDKPSEAELAAARQMLPTFLAYRQANAWNPWAPIRRPVVPV